ncbi:MAG: FadR family transcriptional regulator [Firmicutes bacterium]|nr:FadR family transcriptional regulator [Bacillota bacterium]
MLKPLKDRKVADAVVDYIITKIASGELKVGEQLPPQSELAAELGVSRTAVREAMRSLSLMGMLRIDQGRGTFVNQTVPGLFIEPLAYVLSMDHIMLLEIVEARAIIEAKTAYLCALRATDKEISALEVLTRDMMSKIEDLDSFNELDLDFHVQVARGSHNSVLVAVIEAMQGPLSQQLGEVQRLPGAARRAVEYHRRVVKGLHDRDPEAATKAMKEHLDDVRRAVLQNIAKSECHSDYRL